MQMSAMWQLLPLFLLCGFFLLYTTTQSGFWTQNIRDRDQDQDQDPGNLPVALMHLKADLTVLILAPEDDPQVLDILLVVQLPLGQKVLQGLVLVLEE